MHHQARRQAEKIDAAIRFEGQDGRDRQTALAELHGFPGAGIQGVGQPLIEPCRAGRRSARRRFADLAGAIRPAQAAAQGVSAAHRLDIRQLRPPIRQHHAREADGFRHFQAAPDSLVTYRRRPRMIRNQQQVATKQLLRLLLQRQADTVSEKADGRYRRHGNHQCGQQQAEFA